MERLNAFIDNIRDRLNNPLIFSFLVSWIFFNWKIAIALFWDNPTGSIHNQFSLINHIESHLSLLSSLIWPLGSAVLYTFISPVIKNLITAFQNWNYTWGENWNIFILKKSKVTMEKYLSLRKNYDSRSKELEQILEKENEMSNTIIQLKSDLGKVNSESERLKQELSNEKAIVENLNKIEILEGSWVRIVKIGSNITQENIQISNNIISIYGGNAIQNKYTIHDFVYNTKSNYVHFVLFENNSFYSFNRLTRLPSNLSGSEYRHNSTSDVTYARSTGFLDKNNE